MRCRIYLISFFLLVLFSFSESNIIYSQPQRPNFLSKKKILVEKNILPHGDSLICFISYRIPLSDLIFIKSSNGFSSGFSLYYQIKSNDNIVLRNSISKTVNVESYTESNEQNKFVELLAHSVLAKDNYVVLPSIQFYNSDETLKLDSITIPKERIIKNSFLSPIVIEQFNNKCDENNNYRLTNWGNTIPFAPNDYSLLIPFVDKKYDKIIVKIEQAKKVVYEKEILKIESDQINISDCNGALVLIKDKSRPINYFIIDKFNGNLKEGNIVVKILTDGGKETEFNLRVVWHDKPISLFNTELAVELLSYIADKSTIEKILEKSTEQYYEEITNFFDSKLPDKKYVYNELMTEYYKRADYSMNNFTTIDKQNGALSDRGKIYIIYGQPDKIERDYSLNNSIAEVWYYANINKAFVFIDETGLGNYKLKEK